MLLLINADCASSFCTKLTKIISTNMLVTVRISNTELQQAETFNAFTAAAETLQQPHGYTPSCIVSQTFGRYKIILPGDRSSE